jgi:hypothetical protein
MGDMNNIMHANEKLGPTRADIKRINTFCAHVKQCGFGPVRLSYNPYFLAYFFSRNNVFLSQQISEQYFSHSFSAKRTGPY